VHIGRPPRRGPDGVLRYGWDERLRLGRGRLLRIHYTTAGGDPAELVGRFERFERGASLVRVTTVPGHDVARVAAASIWNVSDA
jgi:hypothetical protein